jgi:hypothetical protein
MKKIPKHILHRIDRATRYFCKAFDDIDVVKKWAGGNFIGITNLAEFYCSDEYLITSLELFLKEKEEP